MPARSQALDFPNSLYSFFRALVFIEFFEAAVSRRDAVVAMKRDILETSGLPPQAALCGVEFCGGKVTIAKSLDRKGSGLLVTRNIDEENAVLVRVPSDLVLSLEVGSLVLDLAAWTCPTIFLLYLFQPCKISILLYLLIPL